MKSFVISFLSLLPLIETLGHYPIIIIIVPYYVIMNIIPHVHTHTHDMYNQKKYVPNTVGLNTSKNNNTIIQYNEEP